MDEDFDIWYKLYWHDNINMSSELEIPVTNKGYFIDMNRRYKEHKGQPVLFKVWEISQININVSQMNIWLYIKKI